MRGRRGDSVMVCFLEKSQEEADTEFVLRHIEHSSFKWVQLVFPDLDTMGHLHAILCMHEKVSHKHIFSFFILNISFIHIVQIHDGSHLITLNIKSQFKPNCFTIS